MFSCEYCEIFINTYIEEHLRTTFSDNNIQHTILILLLLTLNKYLLAPAQILELIMGKKQTFLSCKHWRESLLKLKS